MSISCNILKLLSLSSLQIFCRNLKLNLKLKLKSKLLHTPDGKNLSDKSSF